MRFVTLITGASSGIGAQLALQWAKRASTLPEAQNLVLILAARRMIRLEALSKECRVLHPPTVTHLVPCDLRFQTECERLIRIVETEYKHLDRLYLNAGRLQRCLMEEMEATDALEMMNLNFWSNVWLANKSLPLLKVSKNCGRLIVVNSLFGKIPVPQHAMYCASKHALRGFFYSLACEQKHLQSQHLPSVGITSVFPGAVETEITHNMVGPHGSRLKVELTKVKVPSLLSAEEAAQQILQAGEDGKVEYVFPQREKEWVRKSVGGNAQEQQEVDEMFRRLLFPNSRL